MQKLLLIAGLLCNSFALLSQQDDPRARMQEAFDLIKDPATGRVPIEELIKAREEVRLRFNSQIAVSGVNWYERGPNNIGGRTRAMMFDPNDATSRKVWSGGVGGGLWYINDITSATETWTKIDDFWANIAVSTMAYSPANTQTFYVGTGEGWGSIDAQQGAGIWKSTNGGTTWTQLSATNNSNFYYVQKLVVNNTGVVFAATRTGLYKSVDGGTTWTVALQPTTVVPAIAAPVTNNANDIEIASDGVIYVSFGVNQGSRIFKSSDVGVTWTQITPDANQKRTEIALAPSTSGASQVIYAMAEAITGGTTAWIKKSIDAGTTWTDINPTSSLTGNQAWYDMILAVRPDNANVVIGGGNVIGRTIDGGTNWIVRSYYGENLHPDHHAIVFRPGFPNEAIFGNDGGVYYSPDYGNTATSTPTFLPRNNGYSVTQYYSVAIKNIVADGYVLAGAQDNGTHKITTTLNKIGNGTQATGGDGMLCFIDQDESNIQITSYQNGAYNLYHGGSGLVQSIGISGTRFIGPADYNSTQNILYSEKDNNTLNQVKNIAILPAGNFSLTKVLITHNLAITTTCIRAGITDNTVFIGASNGNVYKIINVGDVGGTQTTTTVATGFTGSVSCIEIGATENELLVTRSSYNVVSVHYSTDGGTTWISKDDAAHGLPNIPVRFALFNPKNRKQVLLATELGIFSTNDITATNPGWQPTNTALANVSCYMLRYRPADGTVAVATHGRGVYTMQWCTSDITFTGTLSSVPARFNSTTWIKGNTNNLVQGLQTDYSAGQYVLLQPNFEASSGSFFKAYVGGCQ